MLTGHVGHYYFLLNGEFIVDKCIVDEGQSIDGIYIRKLNFSHVDIQTESYIFEGDVVFNLQSRKFEIISHELLRRNYIFQKGILNLFHIQSEQCEFVYDESL